MKIGIVAGTPIDTDIGYEVFAEYNIPLIKCAIAVNPHQQTIFQNKELTFRQDYVYHKLMELKEQGCKIIIIYCNSLASTLDLDKLKIDTNLKIITPLSAYQEVAISSNSVALITANTISLYNIEKLLKTYNPNLITFNFTSLKIVEAIEAKQPSSQIISEYKLESLCHYFESLDVDAIILGCTHYDVIFEELKNNFTKIYLPTASMKVDLVCFLNDVHHNNTISV